jgi:hypothetical protein
MSNLTFKVTRAMTSTPKWKLIAYTTAGVNFPVESTTFFNSDAEAQAACDRANAGDENGISFASYSDD